MQLLIPVDTALVSRLVTLATANGRTLEDQILTSLTESMGKPRAPAAAPAPARQTLDVEATMALAMTAASARPKGAEFQLQDLIAPETWPLVENTRSCGRTFRKRIEKAGIATFIGRTQSRHAVYRRN